MLEEIEVGPFTDTPRPFADRDGTNPIERKAVFRAQLEIRSMPASLVVQIALWPDKLSDWADEMGIAPSVVYNMLAGTKPYHRVRTLLARRLNVYKQSLDHLIDAPRPEPLANLPPEPPTPARPRRNPRAGRSGRTVSGIGGAGSAGYPHRAIRAGGERSGPQTVLNL